MSSTISVDIPVYNSESTFPKLFARLITVPNSVCSNYDLYKLIKFAMLVLTGSSAIHLIFVNLFGFFPTFFGIAVLLFVLVQASLGDNFPGFPFQASIISIFSGAQLFGSGIFDEYLARVFNSSMRVPTYVVSEIDNPKKSKMDYIVNDQF